ncbi:8784_t:CDS:2, partial [Dentiscutata erythropus]
MAKLSPTGSSSVGEVLLWFFTWAGVGSHAGWKKKIPMADFLLRVVLLRVALLTSVVLPLGGCSFLRDLLRVGKKIPMSKLSSVVLPLGGSSTVALPVDDSPCGFFYDGSSCGRLFLWVLRVEKKIPMVILLSLTGGSSFGRVFLPLFLWATLPVDFRAGGKKNSYGETFPTCGSSRGRLLWVLLRAEKKFPRQNFFFLRVVLPLGGCSFLWVLLWVGKKNSYANLRMVLRLGGSPTGEFFCDGSSCGRLFLWVLLRVKKKKIPMAILLSSTVVLPPK